MSTSEALSAARRKLALRDWNLRLTPDEAEALRAWILNTNAVAAERRVVLRKVRSMHRDALNLSEDQNALAAKFLRRLEAWLIARNERDEKRAAGLERKRKGE